MFVRIRRLCDFTICRIYFLARRVIIYPMGEKRGKTGKNSAKPSDVRFTISLSYYFKRDVFTTSKTGLESKKKEKVSFSFSLQLASCSREEEGF